MIRRRAPLAVLFVVCWALAIAARAERAERAPQAGQTPPTAPPAAPPAQQPTFRTRIDSVSVDVMVTDKQGQPVTDLAAADFDVRESNKPQTIDTFKLVKIDEAADVDPATVREIHSMQDQEREASRDDVRLLVIFLDDYHVRRGNGLRARDQLANFVSALSPRDLVAVMYPLTPVTTLTFSYNHSETARAILNFEGRKYDYTPRNGYENQLAYMTPEAAERTRNEVTITALRGLCTFLGTLREGRKTVLFFSEGLNSALPGGVNTRGTYFQPSGTSREVAFAGSMELLDDLQQVYAVAGRSNSSVYTLDPRGLASSEFQIDDNVMGDADRRILREATDTLHTIADQTGGRAIVNKNDPRPELKQMLRDTSAYYLLSYTSSVAPRDGKFHEIQVRVKRKDVEVRARRGYWAYSAADVAKMTGAATPKPGPPPEVEEALATIEPSRGHAVSLWLGAERGPAGKDTVTLVWEATADASTAPAEAADHITVTANSVYGDTLFRGPVPRDPQTGRATGRIAFDAPPGSVHVQVSAENAKGQRIDRDDRDVEAPDFTGTGPAITTPAVFRARTARDVQQIRAATAPLPTVTRSFSRIERLLLRFQVYGPAGTTPAITLRLLNKLGQSMAALPAPTRTADSSYEAEIGLGPLPPGEYLIEIATEAQTGKARTLLAIQVTG